MQDEIEMEAEFVGRSPYDVAAKEAALDAARDRWWDMPDANHELRSHWLDAYNAENAARGTDSAEGADAAEDIIYATWKATEAEAAEAMEAYVDALEDYNATKSLG